MSGWYGPEVFKVKECAVCGEKFKPCSGVHRFCTEQCKGEWQYISGRVSTESQYEIINRDIKKYFGRLCNKESRKGNISSDECVELWNEQEGLCALSSVPMTHKLEKGIVLLTNASLDRIEHGGPYIKSNIRLVCRIVNTMRWTLADNELVWWCKKIIENA